MTHVVRMADYLPRQGRRKGHVYFNRSELKLLLAVYSDRVACGQWRDYAIDHAVGIAVFSVFRHTADRPAFAVAKSVGPAGVDYAVFDERRRLKGAASLAEVLCVFERRLEPVD